MTNSVFRKTMENVEDRVDIKIMDGNEKEKIENLQPARFTRGTFSFQKTWPVSTCIKASYFSTNLFTLA